VATDEDALIRFKVEAFDVIISDVVMPGINGLDILEQPRVLAPQAPVILITAYAPWRPRSRLFEGGAADFLLKPFRSDDLLARVQWLQNGAVAKQPLLATRWPGSPCPIDPGRA
jgi:two-component system response regulator ArlR